MKNFDDYFRQAMRKKLTHASELPSHYALALLNWFDEETQALIAEWAIRYLANDILTEAAEAQYADAAKEVPEGLTGRAFAEAVYDCLDFSSCVDRGKPLRENLKV